LAPGLYLWLRDEQHLETLRSAFQTGIRLEADEGCHSLN
jgi:hypothetical protein